MGKFYAVANGRRIGVYTSWHVCQEQVYRYSHARYKAFATREEASAFVSSGGRYSTVNYEEYSDNSYSDYSDEDSDYTDDSAQVIYTDGSALKNGRRDASAGWGVYWGEDDYRNSSGKVKRGEMTNNRGELSAIRHAVKTIYREAEPGWSYEIRTDSQYALNCIETWGETWESNGWKTKKGGPVRNQDLIQSIRQVLRNIRANDVYISLVHVPGHAGHEGNEAADQLAREAAMS